MASNFNILHASEMSWGDCKFALRAYVVLDLLNHLRHGTGKNYISKTYGGIASIVLVCNCISIAPRNMLNAM